MKTLLTLLLAAFCAATGYGQTIKTLGYNTTNGQVVYSGTNTLTFTTPVNFAEDVFGSSFETGSGSNFARLTSDGFQFGHAGIAAATRTNLALGATWLTNTNVANFRTAIGLGAEDSPQFDDISSSSANISGISANTIDMNGAISWTGTNATANAATTRANLALGATNSVTFGAITVNDGSGNNELRITEGGFLAVEGTNELGSLDFETRDFTGGVFTFEQGLHSRGNIVITNQSATNNGILFIYRTNNEPFLGLANLIASNNTTISNETLFRVGVAEATNRSAQFGFRSTNTNGSGVAVFSVFGYNALAMIGPSARSATNTNGIEADIYSINPTNKVATLIDTNTGATLMHRPVGFATNASTPSSTNTIVGWIEFFVGTNSVRVPYYQ